MRLRVELGATERLVRELGGNKRHLRLVADLFERTNELEAEMMLAAQTCSR